MFGSAPPEKRSVALYTSLPPKITRMASNRNVGAAYQRACISSWRQLGFEVVSLNSRSEIAALSEANYDVIFHEVASARPRIVDFLNVIQSSGRAVAGIINADCLLLGNNNTMDVIINAAHSGLVLAERINLRPEDAQVTGESCYGFDLLCFATRPLHLLKFDTEISIGTPWWDYWFPLTYQQSGGRLFTLPAPILMHLNHAQNWSWQTWATQGRRMHAALSANATAAPLPFISAPDGQLTDTQLHAFAVDAFAWLKKSSSMLELDDPNVWLLLSFLSGVDNAARELSRRQASLADQASILSELRAKLDERDAQLAQQSAVLSEQATMLAERNARIFEIEDSLVWKLTRPVRAIASGFPFVKNEKKLLR